MDNCELGLQIASIVVDAAVGVLTLLALKAALTANKQNREEMKMTSKIEERSANIALLDKRLSIIQNILDDKRVSDEILYVMFDAIDSKTNQELHQRLDKIEQLEDLRKKAIAQIYKPTSKDSKGKEYPTHKKSFERLTGIISKGAATQPIWDQYHELCDMNKCPVRQSNGHTKGVALYEIEEELKTEKEEYKKAKEQFIDILRTRVRSGIQTIGEDNNK